MTQTIKRIILTLSIVIFVAVGLYVGWVVALAHAFGAFDPTYTKADLIRHYEVKAAQIWALSTYVNSLVPAHHSVEMEFDGSRTISIFHVKSNGVYSSNWSLALESPKADSLLQQLGWTRQTVRTLQEKLDQVGCISVASGEPCTIGYQRSGMGKYSYKLFARPMSDSVRAQYNASCTYIFYQPQVVLEYGGGAVGPQCFEEESTSRGKQY